jgi:iron complex transport system ATP-binding protein
MINMTAPIINLGGRIVLWDVVLRAGPGELVVLAGPNGAGKTTLLRAMAGLLPGFQLPDPRRTAYVPQGAACAWGMTVQDVIALGRIPHGDQAQAPIDAAIAACGLDALRDHRIDRVSGGEARRAMLARALATEPDMLLLDEPTADLDPAACHAMMALLRRKAQAGSCIVTVLHALDLALHHATRLVVIEAGRIVADGTPDATLPRAAQAFGLPFGPNPRPGLLPPQTERWQIRDTEAGS